MTDIDKVAEAIYSEIHSNKNYSAMDLAQAVVDALQLTEEVKLHGHGHIGARNAWVSPPTSVRLVSPWVRVEKP